MKAMLFNGKFLNAFANGMGREDDSEASEYVRTEMNNASRNMCALDILKIPNDGNTNGTIGLKKGKVLPICTPTMDKNTFSPGIVAFSGFENKTHVV